MGRVNRIIAFGITAGIAAAAVLIAAVSVAADGLELRPDRRAIFDENFSWVTREGADEFLDRIQAAGFNAVVVCVWHGRGTSWPSDLAPAEPRWDRVRQRNPDPLAYLVREAHDRGVEVHAWFTIVLRQRDFFPEYYDGIGDRDSISRSFNVHRPAFRDFIVGIVEEAVKRYPFDGINLDYMRSMGVCTSEYCRNDYRERTGRNLGADVDIVRRSPDAWASIARWNAEAVTSVVSRISVAAREARPDILISVDSHIGRRQLELQGADSVPWANSGLVDIIFDMSYEAQLDLTELNRMRARLAEPKKMVLLVGNFERSIIRPKTVFPRRATKVKALLESAAEFGRDGHGAALYDYTYLSKEQIRVLKTLKPLDH